MACVVCGCKIVVKDGSRVACARCGSRDVPLKGSEIIGLDAMVNFVLNPPPEFMDGSEKLAEIRKLKERNEKLEAQVKKLKEEKAALQRSYDDLIDGPQQADERMLARMAGNKSNE